MTLRILSLGAGVQSSTILLMSIRGELPPIDHAVFADVGWEPAEVYRWLDFLRVETEKAGVPLHVVSAGNLREHVMEAARTGKRVSSPPFFTQGEDGRAAIINRSCTSNFKIAPIERKVKELIGHKPGSRLPKQCAVEQWIGISGDEIQRMKLSTAPWMRFWHPLIEMPWTDGPVAFAPLRDHPMTRDDCLRWMSEHGYPVPPRSACIGCPFHNNHEWRRIRADPDQWADAVEFDHAIRSSMPMHGMDKPVYLHRSLKPLAEAPIDDDEPGQQSLFGMQQECHGMCGL
jgi:hypothetical protein